MKSREIGKYKNQVYSKFRMKAYHLIAEQRSCSRQGAPWCFLAGEKNHFHCWLQNCMEAYFHQSVSQDSQWWKQASIKLTQMSYFFSHFLCLLPRTRFSL